MKNKKLILCLVSTLALTLTISGCGKKAKLDDPEKTAVAIGKTEISATTYYEEIKKANISELIDMIDHKILDKEYKTDDAENEYVKKQIDGMKENYSSLGTDFDSILKQYFGVDSEEELEKLLRLEYKRNQAVNDYILNNLTDKEIEKYYDENIVGDIKAHHILISVDVKDDATSEEKETAEKNALDEAKDIIKKLNDGKDFKELAKKHSDDKATAENGGDLDYFDPNEMVEEFADAVKKLENGKYTKEPVKTKYGYHIILKVDQKEKDKLKNVKDKIKETLTSKKLEESNTVYYETLIKFRESKKVKWNDSELEKAYNEYMDKLIKNATSSN